MVSQGKNNDLPDKDTLRRYLQGKLPPDEAHRIEKLILNNPFYQDALDGLETLSEEELEKDLKDLSQQIRDKTHKSSKVAAFNFYRLAAAILLLAVFSFIIIYTTSRMGEVSKNETLSQKKEMPDEGEQAPAEAKVLATDSILRSKETEDHDAQQLETDIVTQEKVIAEQVKDISVSDPLKESSEESIDIVEEKTDAVTVLSEAKESELDIQKEESIDAAIPEESPEVLAVAVSEEALEAQDKLSAVARTDEEKSIDIQDNDIQGNELENLSIEQEAESAKISGEPAPVLSDYRDATGGKRKEKKMTRQADSQAAGIPETAAEPSAYSEMETEDILKPVPVDGYENYNKYIDENLNYPSEELEKKIEGTVKIRFIINKDSIPDKIRVIQSLSPDCDKEAKRLLKEGPKWIPVYMDGEINETELEYNIYFQLEY